MEQAREKDAQFLKMTETPIPKLVTSLAVPTIISMMITSIYNMADTFFVSKLGTSATGAVGVVFSLMAIIQAVGFMLGMGSGSTCSRLLGQRKEKEADTVGSSALFAAVSFGLILTVGGLLGLDLLMRLLGATETILPYARDYARYILFGAPIMCASFVMNNLLRSQGRAVLSMMGIGFGGLLNILLDPLFIFGLQMGIAGAAVATLISQCVSFCILFSFFLRGKSSIHLSVANISRGLGVYGTIIKTGMPSFCRQGLASVANIALNLNAAVYGDAAVAAMSVVGRVFMFIFSFMIGFGQGFQPVAGYNYGAEKYGRVKQAFWFTVKVGMVVLGSMAVLGFVFAPQIMAVFRKDDAMVIAIGTLAFRAQCVALPLSPLYTATNMMFQTTGQAGRATFLAMARQGLFFIPLVLTLPRFWGLLGVQLAQPAADLLSFVCTIFMLVPFFGLLSHMEEGQRVRQEETAAQK